MAEGLPLSDAGLHPVIADASQGIFPPWASASHQRRAHMARVAGLLGDWARARRETPRELARWKAAGFLHDVLRDGEDEALRELVDPKFRTLPAKVLHGPAASRRLREEGVEDEELLNAVAYHTLGSAGFGRLGLALYSADFLEPGRESKEAWRSELRRRAPSELHEVAREILAARMGYLIERGRPLHPETCGFWNYMSEGQSWASASEY